MDDLETQLRRYADHVEDQVGQIPPFGATRRPTSSRRWPIYAAAAFLLVVGIGVATWLTGDDESSIAVVGVRYASAPWTVAFSVAS